MKKKYLFVFIIMFIFISSVNAENKKWIEYDWSIKQGPSSNWLYYDFTIEDNDGYVTSAVDENVRGVIRKVTKDGQKIIWERFSDDSIYLHLNQDKNYYYTVDYNVDYDTYGEIYFCRYEKSNGQKDECIKLDDSDKEIYEAEIYTKEDVIYVSALGKISDDNYGAARFYTIKSDRSGMILEKAENYADITPDVLKELTDYRDQAIANKMYDIYPYKTENIIISNQFESKDAFYIVGDAIKDNITRGFIMKVDLDMNVIWVQKSEEGYHYFDASSTSTEYIAVGSYKDEVEIGEPRNPDNVESYIFIYDSNGNLVETHDVAKEIGVTRADITSINNHGDAITLQAYAYDENGEFSSYLTRYLPQYPIKTIVKGSGKIEVINKNYSGENITYIITPEKGYVLGMVKVYDEDGNVIEVTGNSFIMPASAVTIEAIFLPENPDTFKELSAITAFASVIIGGLLGYLLVNNKNHLKKDNNQEDY